jgi:restriction system protein
VAIPDFQTLMRPVLEVHADGRPRSASEVRDAVAALVGVTDEDRKVMLPSGGAPLYSNKVAWAVTHLAQAALLTRPGRGITQITDRGQQVMQTHPKRVDMRVLNSFAEYVEFRNRTRERRAVPATGAGGGTELSATTLTPREAMEEVIETAHSAVAAELLARVVSQPPEFLERLVLRLMVAMG